MGRPARSLAIPLRIRSVRRVRHGPVAAALLLAGCVAQPPLAPETPAAVDVEAACVWLHAGIDRLLAAAGTGDAGSVRLAGFPGFRADRLLASFADEVTDVARLKAWLTRLAELDAQARDHELAVLDPPAHRHLLREWRAVAAGHDLPEEPGPALAACREHWQARLLVTPAAVDRLRRAADVPDAYRDWQRAAGLYPLVAPLVRPRVVALHARMAAQFGGELPAGMQAGRYAAALPDDSTASAPLPAMLPADALGIPLLDEAARTRLLAAHAPAWLVAAESDADQPGAVLLDGRDQPFVAPWHPVEYRALGWTRMGDRVLVQLRYTLWFSERPRTGPLDIYAGRLDAVTWRVTLDEQGQVLAYDSMHGCGCYYLLMPGPGWRVAAVGPREEPVFAPAPAPLPEPGERIELRLAAGTHYLRDVRTVSVDLPARELIALNEDSLRSLPRAAGGSRSAYRPDGLIPVSRRPERFLLWPLGVPSAGALRQPGTHAIAFIGRRHFDDPRLLQTLLEPSR